MPSAPRSLLLVCSLVVAVAVTGFAFFNTGRDASAGVPESLVAPAPRGQLPVEAIVDHRQGVMRAVSGNIAASAAILIDGAPFEDRIGIYGTALGQLLADIPSYFPEGTTHDESDARPEVWANFGTFSERAGVTAERAAAFAQATQGGDRTAMTQAFLSLGESCRACHDDFRY